MRAILEFQSTPLIRGETRFGTVKAWKRLFQSTPLIRGETTPPTDNDNGEDISIHSPHTRGDALAVAGLRELGRNFNPLPSYEGRLLCAVSARLCQHFNPLPSYEGRLSPIFLASSLLNFNPLPSYEGRRSGLPLPWPAIFISIHSPHTRGDDRGGMTPQADRRFQSTPLIRGETHARQLVAGHRDISIHSPHTRGDGVRIAKIEME